MVKFSTAKINMVNFMRNRILVSLLILIASFTVIPNLFALSTIYDAARMQREVIACARRMHQLRPQLSAYADTQVCTKATKIMQPIFTPCFNQTRQSFQACVAPRLTKLNQCMYGKNFSALAYCVQNNSLS
jgi:hypothetical protein